MNTAELLDTVERLCAIELDTLDRDELADVVTATSRVRGWLDALDLRCARQGRSLADAGRAEPATALIAKHSNRSSRDADQIARRDTVAAAMPTFEDGLTDGAVSAGHLDAIANATRTAAPEVRAAFASHEDELLTCAAGDTIDTFARRCRSLVNQLTAELTGNDATELDRQRAASNIRRWVDKGDGMHHTHAALDPLRDEIMWNAINRALRKLQQVDGNARTPWNQMQVDALITAVQGGNGTQPAHSGEADSDVAPSPVADIARDAAAAVDRAIARAAGVAIAPHPVDTTDSAATAIPDSAATIEAEIRHMEQRVTEISVLVDFATLTSGLHENGICETEDGTPLPVSTVRRLCCDAEIIPIVLGGDGVPLDLGRTSRSANRAQRRALRSMHRTCAHPDCTVPFSQTKAHHIRWWRRDQGPTDIDNLIPLCEKHHHVVHEGGWGLSMTPDRVATWTRPDGTVHWTGSTIDRTNRPPTCGDPPAA